MTPGPDRLFGAIHATWPAARIWPVAGFTLRDGAGGGKRVSAATWDGDGDALEARIDSAEAAMREAGQAPLFMVPADADALDAALATRGYTVADPTVLWLCPVDRLTNRAVPRLTAFCVGEPLAVMREIWEAGGIGPARVQVMERAGGPKTGLFGRTMDQPAGAGFCAVHDRIAMVHALEIAAAFRRQGLGAWMMRQAAFWAREQGAEWMAVLCTEANSGANALYDRLRMQRAGGYHYRMAPEAR
ncbi:GNAT family N-acetyltransferase [Citreimonas sp.]|uniref:GNAT family N-acetyltransferase n=1 Tax=Citreimonas sp. TaxID=3036715 RepID=UPI0035C7963C